MLLFIFFCCFTRIVKSQIILNNYLPTCDFNLRKNEALTVLNKNWNVSKGNVQLIFNLCENINEGECFGKPACFINQTAKSIQTIDKRNIYSYSSKPTNISDNFCYIFIKWDCTLLNEKDIILNVTKKCVFEVSLMSLSSTCPRCGIILNSQLFDLSFLRGIYLVPSKIGNFSVSLCNAPNPACQNATTCLLSDKKNIPISLGNELITYLDDTKQIKVHNKNKFDYNEVIFELYIKCDWSAKEPKLHYKEVPVQGKRYQFEMTSKRSCVKLPPICQAIDKYYKYNLSNVYSKNGYVEAKNVLNNNRILLNICGPLKLPNYLSDNLCTDSSSQICEITVNNTYINRGSTYLNTLFSNDKISMSLISFITCNYTSNTKYTTRIDFYCSKDDTNLPVLIKSDKCELLLNWGTPAACPQPDETTCENVNAFTSSCLRYNQTYGYFNHSYDLSKLYNPLGYNFTIGYIEYRINICGSVLEKEAPCKKNSMFLIKYLNETNLRKRVKSIGNLNKIFVKGDYLVIETSGGDSCTQGQDYMSTIYFNCTNEKSNIKLINSSSSCKLELLWNTKFACPKKIILPDSCLFHYPIGDFLLDFNELSKTSLKVNVSGQIYLFDLCGNGRKNCDSKDCIYVPVNKNIVTYQNKTHFNFHINQTCDEKIPFNSTIIELSCDKLTHNEHYKIKGLEDCKLLLEFKTSKACFNRDLIIPLIEHRNDKLPHYYVDTNSLNNCNVTNPLTGYEYNIEKLNLNVSFTKCSRVFFDYENKTVNFRLDSSNICKENGKIFTYNVVLKCTTGLTHNVSTEGSCTKNITYELSEICKLIEKNIDGYKSDLTAGTISGIIIAVILIIASGILFGFYICKHIRNKHNFSYGIVDYEKNADL